jgi:hypothetical protein
MRRRPMGRRGRGVVGTVARTAVIAGTATATAGAVNRRQQNRQQAQYDEQMEQQAVVDSQQQIEMLQSQMEQMQAQQAQAALAPQAPAAVPQSAAGGDLIGQLQQLAQLKEAGVLSDAEFEAAKAQVRAGG